MGHTRMSERWPKLVLLGIIILLQCPGMVAKVYTAQVSAYVKHEGLCTCTCFGRIIEKPNHSYCTVFKNNVKAHNGMGSTCIRI